MISNNHSQVGRSSFLVQVDHHDIMDEDSDDMMLSGDESDEGDAGLDAVDPGDRGAATSFKEYNGIG